MLFNLPFFTKRNELKPVVLVVLDGFGIAPHSSGNAITQAKKPNWDKYWAGFPHGELIASGESVGLPANEVGNTEVGHLTIGAGRTILQDLKRINLAIEKGTFFDNKAFVTAASHVKTHNSGFHILGLASSGNVHSSLEHLFGTLQFCKKEGLSNVYLHLFTDGRDAPPNEGSEIIQKVEDRLKILRIGKIASVSGRYYGMDRDKRWERTEKVYKAIVSGLAPQAPSAVEAVERAYQKGQTDEFIEPTLITDERGQLNLINNNDSLVFFNYRIDRAKQLTMSFVLPNFENPGKIDFGYDPISNKSEHDVKVTSTFTRAKILQNLFCVTMTEYHKDLPVSGVAFGPEVVQQPLGLIFSDADLKQMHMAESEKERFVTYYFNGLREERLKGEDVKIVQSPKVETYDKKPEMALPSLAGEFRKQVNRDIYHFFVINFANADMVAHTGNLGASIKAAECVDKYLGELVDSVLTKDGTVVVTADHGNCEELITFPTASYFITSNKGTVNTDHSNNPVPILIINRKFAGLGKNPLPKGALSDVAPTILAMMGIQKPEVMTGRNLLESINKTSINYQ